MTSHFKNRYIEQQKILFEHQKQIKEQQKVIKEMQCLQQQHTMQQQHVQQQLTERGIILVVLLPAHNMLVIPMYIISFYSKLYQPAKTDVCSRSRDEKIVYHEGSEV